MEIKPSSEFEVELARRTLVSEWRRTQILAGVLSVLTSVILCRNVIAHWRGETLPGFGWLVVITGFGCAYEWFASWVIARAIRRDLQPALFRFYLNAVVELAVPTMVMLVYAAYTDPVNAISGPASYAYFLLIIASALRLDFPLCIFTGVVAAGSYAFVGACHWHALEEAFAGPPGLMHFSFAMRNLMFLLGGVVAGLVSVRLRTTLVETMATIQERERIMSLFGQHVSPAVVNQLLAQPKELISELREVCVLVLDIRNFTTFSEGRVAEDVVAYLNSLWTFMVHTVNEHHGIVNKFLGDGFLAVFGAPISKGNDCDNALAAARRILTEIDELTTAGRLPPTEVGIALHWGEVIVGNIGSSERKEYTVIGDVVNVAFRIEALNKEFGSKLLVSGVVREAAAIKDVERIAPMSIRGRREPVELYRVA